MPRRTKKTSDALETLNVKQAKYVEGVVSGKTKLDAALTAGYSESTARAATAAIESPNVRAAFQRLMRQVIPPGRIVKVVGEGLEAFKSWTDGEGETHIETDYRERREYAKMAATLGGYHIEKHIVADEELPIAELTDEELTARAARLLEAMKPNAGNASE